MRSLLGFLTLLAVHVHADGVNLSDQGIAFPDGTSITSGRLPVPTGDLLVVAYINADGVQGFSPTEDLLIASLIDINDDEVPSVGDMVVTDFIPNLDGSLAGRFKVNRHTVSVVLTADSQIVTLDMGADVIISFWNDRFPFGGSSIDQYEESRRVEFSTNEGGGATHTHSIIFDEFVQITDIISNATSPNRDQISTSSCTFFCPSQPDTIINTSVERVGDQPFLDVDFLFIPPP